jgi:hypothetical protein
MAFLDNISQNVETASIYFQGGVRRGIIIFLAICILFLVPVYFFGQLGATVWANLDLNPAKIQNKSIVSKKLISENSFSIDRSQLVPLVNDETVLYTTINNRSNSLIGYWPFVYRMQVLDNKGAIVEEKIERSYLLPGEVSYVVANPGNNLGTRLVVSPEPETTPVLFNPFSISLRDRVNIQVRNNSVVEKENSDLLEIRAILKNVDLVEIKSLDILYIIRDSRDRVVGIGKYQIDYLAPGAEREFYLTYPKPKFRRAVRLDIRTFVNYLDKNSVYLPELIEPGG